jgi:cation/acetate symporter
MSASILCFLVTVSCTLIITIRAARQGQDRAALYAASSAITGTQNGVAIAGDFMSATTVLGLVGLYFHSGVDTAIFFVTPLAAMCLIGLWLAAPLRRLGRFTLGDVLLQRLGDPRMCFVSGVSTIVVSLIYLVAQLVGAGALISLLFGVGFNAAVITIGALMATYVVLGGMRAATWVQIIKAVLLVGGVLALSVMALTWSAGVAGLYQRATRAHALGAGLLQFGGMKLGLFSAVSLDAGLVLGIVGLPHVLVRFFTVPNEAAARRSMVVACGIIAFVFLLTFGVIAPAAVALVTGNPLFTTGAGNVTGGPNMVVIHLARALGGEVMLGVFSAVAFATILAVVAGLTIAIASAASHDLFAGAAARRARTERGELRVFRAAALSAAAIAVGIAIRLQHENVAYLVALALTVAGSANFPVIILALYWRRMTPMGALAGGAVGLVASVSLIVLSPGVWVRVLHHSSAIFPSDYPALISAPMAFVASWSVSWATQRSGRSAPWIAPRDGSAA